MKKILLSIIVLLFIFQSAVAVTETPDNVKPGTKPTTTTTTGPTATKTTTTRVNNGKTTTTTHGTATQTTSTSSISSTSLTSSTVTSQTGDNETVTQTLKEVNVSAAELASAKLTGKDIAFEMVTTSDFSYTWLIYASTITAAKNDISLLISNDTPEKAKIKTILPEGSEFLVLSFEQVGEFPFSSEINFETASVKDGLYYLHKFNKASTKGEYIQDVEIRNGKFKLSGLNGGIYFLSDRMTILNDESGLDSYTKLLIEVAVAMIVAVILGLAVSKIRSKSDKKEDSQTEGEEETEEPILKTVEQPEDEEEGLFLDEGIEVDLNDLENVFVRASSDDSSDDLILGDDKADIEEPDSTYGYGYKPVVDEEFFAQNEEKEDDDSYIRGYADQTDTQGLIMENDEDEIDTYGPYDSRYGKDADPIYGLLFEENESEEETSVADDDFLYDEDNDE